MGSIPTPAIADKAHPITSPDEGMVGPGWWERSAGVNEKPGPIEGTAERSATGLENQGVLTDRGSIPLPSVSCAGSSVVEQMPVKHPREGSIPSPYAVCWRSSNGRAVAL